MFERRKGLFGGLDSGIPIYFTMLVIISALMLGVIWDSILEKRFDLAILAFELILFLIVGLVLMAIAEDLDNERDEKYHTQGI